MQNLFEIINAKKVVFDIFFNKLKIKLKMKENKIDKKFGFELKRDIKINFEDGYNKDLKILINKEPNETKKIEEKKNIFFTTKMENNKAEKKNDYFAKLSIYNSKKLIGNKNVFFQ